MCQVNITCQLTRCGRTTAMWGRCETCTLIYIYIGLYFIPTLTYCDDVSRVLSLSYFLTSILNRYGSPPRWGRWLSFSIGHYCVNMTPLRLVSPESWPWQRWCDESDFLDMFRITFVLAHTPLRIEHGNYPCSMVLCMSHKLISLLWERPGHRHRNHKSSPLDVLIIAFFSTSDQWPMGTRNDQTMEQSTLIPPSFWSLPTWPPVLG